MQSTQTYFYVLHIYDNEILRVLEKCYVDIKKDFEKLIRNCSFDLKKKVICTIRIVEMFFTWYSGRLKKIATEFTSVI